MSGFMARKPNAPSILDRAKEEAADRWEQEAPVGGSLIPGQHVAANVPLDPVSVPAPRAVVRHALLKRRSWEGCDPDAQPARGWHVRLNPYELAIFQAACEVDGRTQQRIGRQIIRTWAEQKLGIDRTPSVYDAFEKRDEEPKASDT